MSSFRSNLAEKEIQESAHEGEKVPSKIFEGKKLPDGQELAVEWLWTNVVAPKQWANFLKVGERYVYKLRNKEIEIKKEIADQIIQIGKLYSLQISRLRDDSDLYLLAQKDPGTF